MFRKEKMNGVGREKDKCFMEKSHLSSSNNHHNYHHNYSNQQHCNSNSSPDVGSSSMIPPPPPLPLHHHDPSQNYFVDHHYYVGPTTASDSSSSSSWYNNNNNNNNVGQGVLMDEFCLTRDFQKLDIGNRGVILSNDLLMPPNSDYAARFGRDVDVFSPKLRPSNSENFVGFEGFGNVEGFSSPSPSPPPLYKDDRNYRLLAERMNSFGDSVGSYSPYVGGAGGGAGQLNYLIQYPLKERDEFYGNGVGVGVANMRGNKLYGDRMSSVYNCNDYVVGNGGRFPRDDVPVPFQSMYGPSPLVDDSLQQYIAEDYKELLNSWANTQNYGALLQNYGGQVFGEMGGLNSLGSSQLIHPRQALSKGNTLYNTMRDKLRAAEQRLASPHLALLKNMRQPYNGDANLGTHGKGLNGSGGRRRTVQKIAERSFDLNGSLQLERSAGIGSPVGSCDSLVFQNLYSSLAEVKGNIHLMAKDQHGCRFLQKKFEDGSFEDVQTIFDEIIDHVVDLMIDPFGNYLVQKLMDVCNEEQRMKIVHVVTKDRGELVRICLNTHGTRVVQKLIDSLRSRKQISLIIRALEPGFLDLIKDLNGNHVVQRCLQCLNYDDNKFIFDAASRFCVEIAMHRHGCCVLQRCIAHSNGDHRKKLIDEICSNGLTLAEDPFGNYVVQYIIELKIPSAAALLTAQFEGHYVRLSMQKFSSHVVEKCLKFIEESQARIVYELLSVPQFEQLLQDPFANYVVQSALEVTKGGLNDSLVTAVRPHLMLRTNPYCKKIFTRGLIRK